MPENHFHRILLAIFLQDRLPGLSSTLSIGGAVTWHAECDNTCACIASL